MRYCGFTYLKRKRVVCAFIFLYDDHAGVEMNSTYILCVVSRF